jgi:hypothetical protein
MEMRPGDRVGSLRVMGDVSKLPGQTDRAGRRRLYASGNGWVGYCADMRGAPDFAE